MKFVGLQRGPIINSIQIFRQVLDTVVRASVRRSGNESTCSWCQIRSCLHNQVHNKSHSGYNHTCFHILQIPIRSYEK